MKNVKNKTHRFFRIALGVIPTWGAGAAVEVDCGEYETGEEGADDGGSLNDSEYISNPQSGEHVIDYELISQIDGNFFYSRE